MMSDQDPRPRQPVGADLIIPVGASLYAVYYMWSVWDFPAEAQRSGTFLAGLLLFFCGLYFLRVTTSALRAGARLDFSVILGPDEGRSRRLAFFVLILAYLVVVRWGGFTLTTFLFLFSASLVAGLRPWAKALLFAGTSAIAGWLFFIVMLGTRFPRGPFERLVTEVVRLWS
jgi:hypothetical protein